jgi:pimeloyl-ACP methyl ester carboxylesterase
VKTIERIGGGRFSVEVYRFGSGGEPILFLHGAGGLFGTETFLEDLGREFTVVAPHLPGFGETTGAELIDDVFDATQFYHQVMDDLGMQSAHVIGHSMGGMLAAEMAAMDVGRVRKLVLAAPAGFWLDQHPVPDLFTASPKTLARFLFHDPESAAAQAMAKMPEGRREFAEAYVERIKRLTVATKFLWPIPDRGLKKRIWRIAAPTLLIWGESDRYIPPVYAGEFKRAIRNCRETIIPDAGHMVMYERPQEFCAAVRAFIKE